MYVHSSLAVDKLASSAAAAAHKVVDAAKVLTARFLRHWRCSNMLKFSADNLLDTLQELFELL